MRGRRWQPERVDPFAEMSATALENVILRLYERLAEARKCKKEAKKLRQRAYQMDEEGRRLYEEGRRDLEHAETMLALRRGQMANVVPFPSSKPGDVPSTRKKNKSA